MPTSDSQTDPPPEYKLYSVGGIALATFLGSLLAGGILLAMNLFRLRRAMAGWWILAAGAVCTVAVLAIGFLMPDDVNIPNSFFVIPQLVLAYFAANRLVGDAIRRHQQVGGKMASLWAATGIGVLVAVILLAIIFGIVLMMPE